MRISVPNCNGFKAKCRGFSHMKMDTACQDAVAYDQDVAVCAVSDGHGSEKYFRSGVGAALAVEVAIEAVKAFMAKQNTYRNENDDHKYAGQILSNANYAKILHNLAGYIVTRWVEQLEEHWQTNPCNDLEKALCDKHFTNVKLEESFTKIYGATLIIGVITERFGFAIQIGDGAACIIKQNGHKLVPPELIDENQFGGRTNSLSSTNCLPLFRFYYTKTIPKAIVVASDGVVDSYGGNDGKDFQKFCAKLVELYADNYEQAQGFLEDWLPQLSEQGSQDDVAVAGIFTAKA